MSNILVFYVNCMMMAAAEKENANGLSCLCPPSCHSTERCPTIKCALLPTIPRIPRLACPHQRAPTQHLYFSKFTFYLQCADLGTMEVSLVHSILVREAQLTKHRL